MTEIEGLILHRLSVEARFPELDKRDRQEQRGDNDG